MLLIRENLDSTDFHVYLTISDQLLVCSSSDGCSKVISLPEPPPAEKPADKIQVVKVDSRVINCVEFSKDQQYVALPTENKQLVILDKKFQVVKNILLARVASKVCFSPTNDILLADRTGDVYLYKKSDHQNKPTLLLGHLSVISDMLVTKDFIVTCDRDEKIRVSCYPNAYNIVSYCLGHKEFVSSLQLIESSNILVSASGDGTVRMWNYIEGKQVNIIDTKSLVSESLLKKFASQMDGEKVEITTLPVINIGLYEKGASATLAVSLLNVDKLFLYRVGSSGSECSLVFTLEVESAQYYFSLCMSLYVLSTSFEVYEYQQGKLESRKNKCQILEKKLLEYKHLFFVNNSDCTLWYKRRFDNVQEYLERKKLRLEAK